MELREQHRRAEAPSRNIVTGTCQPTRAREQTECKGRRDGQSTGERVDGEQMVGSGGGGGGGGRGTAIRAEHIVGLCRRAVWECVCRVVCEAVRLFGASGGFLKIY